MKRLIMSAALAASLFTIQATADSDIYIGLDMISSINTFTLDENSLGLVSANNDSKAFKLKVGIINKNGWRFQSYFLRETYDTPLFDATNDPLNEFGLDIIKGFKVPSEFSPFLQAGFGVGSMNVTGYYESSILEVSLKVGAGIMYKNTPNLELIAGFDFQHRSWQNIQVGTNYISTTEKSTKLYAGINYLF